MQKIQQFNSKNIDTIRAAIDAKLQEVSQEYGIALTIGGMRYSASEITTRLTVKSIGSDIKEGESIQEASDRAEFDRYAQSFGLKPEYFGQVVIVNGKRFRIVGIKPRSSKFPILVQEVGSDKVFKLKVSSIIEQLESKFAA
jgi:hypothetical protein